MRTSYLLHILLWMVPVIALQWGFAWRAFLRNGRAIAIPTLAVGTYFSLADAVAVRAGIWFFDPRQILGIHIGPLPIEEILFFYVTALLVAQSFVMLLPRALRR